MPDVMPVWNAGLCSGMHGYFNQDGCEAVLKFFTKTKKKQKKIKKDAFLPAMMADGSQGLRAKNTLFGEKRRKGRFFPKQPEGLDLDGLGYQG